MSFNVKVSGIPKEVKLDKLIPLFSSILSLGRKKFHLQLLPSHGPEKDVLISLPTYAEAQLAQQKLDNFIYKHNNVTYSFTAVCSGSYRQQNKKFEPYPKFQNQNYHRSHEPYQNKRGSGASHYRGGRSRSPQYKDASYDLDMQIEILRKQRIILEEERKLLEERRRLDHLKMKSFNIETSPNKIYDANVEMSGKSPNPSEKNSEAKQLTFHQASVVLLRKMNTFMRKYSSPSDYNALVTHLRSLLKQRLAAVVAADGQGVYQTRKVIMLYRTQYPPTEDEELVKESLKLVTKDRSIDLPEIIEASDKGVSENTSDETEAAEQRTLHKEKASSKDTNLPGSSGSVSDKIIQNHIEREFDENLLTFHKSSGVLLKRMNSSMNKHSRPEKRTLLAEYLRSTLKERLARVVAGQRIYQTHKIVKLYRAKHPSTEDEDLVKQLVKDIDEGLVSEDTIRKNKRENVAEKSADDNNTITEYKIVSGENETDISGPSENKDTIITTRNTDSEGNEDKMILSTENVLENKNDEKETAVIIGTGNTDNEGTGNKMIVSTGNVLENKNDEKETAAIITTGNTNSEGTVDKMIVSTGNVLENKNDEKETAVIIGTGNTDNEGTGNKMIVSTGNVLENKNDEKETTAIIGTGITDNEGTLDKMIESTGNVLENQNDEKATAASNGENGSMGEVKNVKIITNKMDDESQNDLTSIITDKDINRIADNNTKPDTVATEATPKCPDEDVNSKQENRGVKRKIDAIEDSSMKVLKIDAAQIDSADANENKPMV